MLCEYCNQPIPKNKLTCPHCGAANLNYEDESPKNGERYSTIINNNVTINVNAPQNQNKRLNNPKRKEQSSGSYEEIKLSAVCTVVTAFATSIAVTSGLDFFALFYVIEFFGNLLIFTAASVFNAPKFVSVLVCMVFMVIGCVSCSSKSKSSNESYNKTHDFQYSAKETQTARQYKTLPEKPQDGMSFAQLKKQKWGYKFLYTKCRDFDHLRPNKRYYEARWYDSDGNLIGKGLLNCQDEDDDTAILINFKDYTE